MFSHQCSALPARSFFYIVSTVVFFDISHACFLFYSAWFPFYRGPDTADIPHGCVLQGAALLTGVFWSGSFYYLYFLSLTLSLTVSLRLDSGHTVTDTLTHAFLVLLLLRADIHDAMQHRPRASDGY